MSNVLRKSRILVIPILAIGIAIALAATAPLPDGTTDTSTAPTTSEPPASDTTTPPTTTTTTPPASTTTKPPTTSTTTPPTTTTTTPPTTTTTTPPVTTTAVPPPTTTTITVKNLVQLRSDATTVIATGGYSEGAEAIVTCDIESITSSTTTTSTPADPTFAVSAVTYKVHVECVPTSTTFTGTPTHSVTVTATSASITLTGLTDGELYHWSVYATDGVTTSTTVSYGANPETDTDFICGTSPPVNQPPIVSAPGQFDGGGVNPIPTGGVVVGSQVWFKAMVADVDGDTIRWHIERAITTMGFTGNATESTNFLASGSQAQIVVALPVGNWAWKYRAEDSAGNFSPWTSFDINADTVPDLIVPVPVAGPKSKDGGNDCQMFDATRGMYAGNALVMALALTMLALTAARLRP